MRRRVLATWAAGGLGLVLCATWALWPLPAADGLERTSLALAAPGESTPAESRPALAQQAYAASIWNPPPRPQAQQPQASAVARTPPPRLELVAIVAEAGQWKAALYDADAGGLVIVGAGDRVGRHTVSRVDGEGVELSDGQGTLRLRLQEERP